MNPSYMSFWDHVEELRKVFIKSFFAVICFFIVSLYYHQAIFDFLKTPLARSLKVSQSSSVTGGMLQTHWISNNGDKEVSFVLPEGARALGGGAALGVKEVDDKTFLVSPGAIFTYEIFDGPIPLVLSGPIDGFASVFRVCFWIALAAASPLWLFMLLGFIYPALETEQKNLAGPFVIFSCLFFAAGALFALFVTIPMANNYFAAFNLSLGTNLWSLKEYLDFTLLLITGNGIGFELFVLLGFLVHYGKIDAAALASKRRHAIVAALIIGAILTPPDVITQILMAAPLAAFYELSILYARIKSVN